MSAAATLHHDHPWRCTLSHRINTICVGLGCLEIFHLFLPPYTSHVAKLLSVMFSCSTPTLSYLIPPLYLLSFFLFCCVALDFSTIFTRVVFVRSVSLLQYLFLGTCRHTRGDRSAHADTHSLGTCRHTRGDRFSIYSLATHRAGSV